ncbi:MAG: hypothetical protein ACREON_18915, partial [Gemmatimonadaceae bacterium]
MLRGREDGQAVTPWRFGDGGGWRALSRRGASVGMRLGAAAARFALTLLITAYLGVHAAGEFALFLTSATLLGQLIGLDFFTYAMREIASRDEPDAVRRVVAAARHVFTRSYIAGGVLALVPFLAGFIDWVYLPAFLAIALLEQLSQEVYRGLVALRRPVAANACYFVRGALWIVPLAVLLAVHPGSRSLHVVYVAWLLGVTASIALAAGQLRRMVPRIFAAVRPAPGVVAEGVRVAMPYFVASVLLNVVEYSDRYFIGAMLGNAEVGAYWLFRGVTNLVPLAAFFAVYEFGFPDLASRYLQGRAGDFSRTAKTFVLHGLLVTAGCAVIASLAGPVMVALLGQPILARNLDTFYLLIAVAVLASAANALTFVANAVREDRAVLVATAAACAVTLVGNAALISPLG